jgi:hypothetical protein
LLLVSLTAFAKDLGVIGVGDLLPPLGDGDLLPPLGEEDLPLLGEGFCDSQSSSKTIKSAFFAPEGIAIPYSLKRFFNSGTFFLAYLDSCANFEELELFFVLGMIDQLDYYYIIEI